MYVLIMNISYCVFFRFITDLYELWGTKGRIFPFDFIEAYIIHNQNGNALQWNESE